MSNRHRQINSLRSYFPLTTIKSVVDLFQRLIDSNHQPDLTFLSILLGHIEHTLTCAQTPLSPSSSTYSSDYFIKQSDDSGSVSGASGDVDTNGNGKGSSASFISDHTASSSREELEIPPVKWDHVEPLYKKFISQIKGSVDHRDHPKKTSRELIKKVIDAIWSNLTRGYYTNKAHLQTLYSYTMEEKLDRFGVTLAIAAACQVLELNDVRLALSEDHAWVIFGEPGNEQTAEISWRGKGSEDKRGQPVVTANCWLYLNGYPVLCTPSMIVCALVASMNPSISTASESEQLASIQQKLLWVLYDKGLLVKYPMGIGNLGDLEEVNPTPKAPKDAIGLYQEAIEINKKMYDNQHVYPYCFLASYYFRNGRFKEALKSWADAASVIRCYNYTRDDEEIYKEFLEIANDLIPHMVKVVSAGGCEPSKVSKIPLLQDPECFASLLAFYDGLCGWEEESPTPVLHIGWAKPFVATISKFTSHVRNKAQIKIKDVEKNLKNHDKINQDCTEGSQSEHNTSDQSEKSNGPKTCNSDSSTSNDEPSKSPTSPIRTPDEIIKSIEEDLKEDGERIEQNLKSGTYDKSKDELDPQIVKMAAECSNPILNSETLLNISCEPNSESRNASQPDQSDESENEKKHKETSKNFNTKNSTTSEDKSHPTRESNGHHENGECIVYLQSQKMIGLKDLLLAEKLNTSAIQLQLTAQSQVHISKRPRLGSFGSGHQCQGEFDFLATTTIATTLSSVSGVRSSKRTRRD
ncbi:menin [Tetranychus urticae]|uniref:Menin n=1 Tax=Tetranychus urticae TaxID=32264 RepID=T1JTF7_TETUR|nr:menin [Tetranychus urticae]